MSLSPAEAAIVELGLDPVIAHRTIFRDRHKNAEAPFHPDMIERWHSAKPNICEIAFRGSAKSSIGEEGVAIDSCYRRFKNALLLGSSFDLAAQRLHAIRRIFEKNRTIRQLFGDLRGQPWADDVLELSNGVVIRALGRGQALRGTKGEELRPDFVWADDIEDRISLSTRDGREKIQNWFMAEVLPALDVDGRVRITANDMAQDCLANRLEHPDSGFVVHRIPWEYRGPKGERVASWPSRFPLEKIDATRKQFYAMGRGAEYEAEYMCRSQSPETKPFKPDMFRIEVMNRSWQAVYSMTDPARTVSKTAATTARVVWSWIGNKLIVWDGTAKRMMPDEIVADLFATWEQWHCTEMGFEEDGLNEWARQSIRHEGVKRGILLPYRPIKAPKGKLDFIRGLQPFFVAREVVFAKPMPDLVEQFLSFPNGLIDFPNALAYALRMRPGAPIYDEFGQRNVVDGLRMAGDVPLYLALNASKAGLVTGVMVQSIGGAIRVLGAIVREGDAAVCLPEVVSEAETQFDRMVKLIGHPLQYNQYNNSGLVQAARRLQMPINRGAPESNGRAVIRDLIRRERNGIPMLSVSPEAHWAANGFAGGFARALVNGMLSEHPAEGVYRTLMEGLESFAGLTAARMPEDNEEEDESHFAVNPQGRRYRSALR